MLVFLGVLLATVVAYILRFHYEFVRSIYYSMKIPGPRAYPLLGNGLLFINNTSAGISKDTTNFQMIWGLDEWNVFVLLCFICVFK